MNETTAALSGDHDPPPLTVAVPFYSGRQFLFRAIRSVVAQTGSRVSLLVHDDASSEPGIEAFCCSLPDAAIRYVRSEKNLGLAGSWNRCLDLASTELVTLLHADDVLAPTYCSRMRELATEYPHAAAYFCGAHTIDQSGRRRFSLADSVKRWLVQPPGATIVLRGERGFMTLLRGNFIFCPSVCYRMTVVGARRFDPRWSFVLDHALLLRLLLEGATIVGMRAPLLFYRRHDQSATAKAEANLQRFEEEVQLSSEMRGAAIRRGWPRAARLASFRPLTRASQALAALQLLRACAWDKAARLARLVWQ